MAISFADQFELDRPHDYTGEEELLILKSPTIKAFIGRTLGIKSNQIPTTTAFNLENAQLASTVLASTDGIEVFEELV